LSVTSVFPTQSAPTGDQKLRTDNALSTEIFRIALGVFFPLFRQIVEGEDGRDGTYWNAGAAVDAFYGIDVEHFFGRELFGVFFGMNAVDRTGVNTGGIFGSNAGLGNYVGHKNLVLLGAGRVFEFIF
jgi:hypothetical protein